jgi:hypothetical protein
VMPLCVKCSSGVAGRLMKLLVPGCEAWRGLAGARAPLGAHESIRQRNVTGATERSGNINCLVFPKNFLSFKFDCERK